MLERAEPMSSRRSAEPGTEHLARHLLASGLLPRLLARSALPNSYRW